MFRPRYLAFFCGLECYTMEFVVINNRVFFLCYSDYLTFVRIKGHKPFSLP